MKKCHESSLENGRKLSALQSSVYHRDPARASEIAAGSQLLLYSPNFMGGVRLCEKNWNRHGPDQKGLKLFPDFFGFGAKILKKQKFPDKWF